MALCGLSQAAFCDTFDQPAGTGNCPGQLNGTVWGVSHATGADNNSGQGQFNAWSSTQLQTCVGTTTVHPPDDLIICNGQLREAVSDNHTVTTLAMYPKQPLDFAGRTGVVAFDVSNDTVGGHSEWPEFWITDQPVPTPFTFENSWKAAPQHACGVRYRGKPSLTMSSSFATTWLTTNRTTARRTSTDQRRWASFGHPGASSAPWFTSDSVVSIASNAQMTVANVDLILVGAGGVVAVGAPGPATTVATPTDIHLRPSHQSDGNTRDSR